MKGTDAQIRNMVETQFSIITREKPPTVKHHHMSAEDREKWFSQLTFVHFIGFRLFFTEAKERGILNPAEMAAGEELLDILFG